MCAGRGIFGSNRRVLVLFLISFVYSFCCESHRMAALLLSKNNPQGGRSGGMRRWRCGWWVARISGTFGDRRRSGEFCGLFSDTVATDPRVAEKKIVCFHGVSSGPCFPWGGQTRALTLALVILLHEASYGTNVLGCKVLNKLPALIFHDTCFSVRLFWIEQRLTSSSDNTDAFAPCGPIVFRIFFLHPKKACCRLRDSLLCCVWPNWRRNVLKWDGQKRKLELFFMRGVRCVGLGGQAGLLKKKGLLPAPLRRRRVLIKPSRPTHLQFKGETRRVPNLFWGAGSGLVSDKLLQTIGLSIEPRVRCAVSFFCKCLWLVGGP